MSNDQVPEEIVLVDLLVDKTTHFSANEPESVEDVERSKGDDQVDEVRYGRGTECDGAHGDLCGIQ